jgi:hypothetical protein
MTHDGNDENPCQQKKGMRESFEHCSCGDDNDRTKGMVHLKDNSTMSNWIFPERILKHWYILVYIYYVIYILLYITYIYDIKLHIYILYYLWSYVPQPILGVCFIRTDRRKRIKRQRSLEITWLLGSGSV